MGSTSSKPGGCGAERNHSRSRRAVLQSGSITTEELLLFDRRRLSLRGETRRGKYGAQSVEVDGIRFASKREAVRYDVLKQHKSAGDVRWFAMQVPFQLPGKTKYLADFVVVWAPGARARMRMPPAPGEITVEDVKGVRTAVYRLKRRQMLDVHGIEITEV